MRRALIASFLPSMTLAAVAVRAQDVYPSRPIRIVVPFAPGAITDTVGRIVADRISPTLGQPVVLDFKPGAGQQIGIENVAKSPPDGYTLLMPTAGITSLSEVNKAFKMDVTRELVPVSMVASAPLLIVANPQFNSLQDLVDFGRRNPGKVNLGVSGVADVLAGVVFKSKAGFSQQIVRYSGAAPTVQAIATGDIHYSVLALGSVRALADAGRVKILAVTGKERFAAIPNVPSMGELGYPDVDFGFWIGLLAPVGTPQPVADKLSGAMAQAMQNADFRKRIDEAGMVARGTSAAEFSRLFREEVLRNRKVIQDHSINFD